jgi:hypothetical protein
MPPPVALTDAQMMAILAAAAPLAAHDRNPFLLEVAQLLQALPEVGDGTPASHPPQLSAHAVPAASLTPGRTYEANISPNSGSRNPAHQTHSLMRRVSGSGSV